MVAPRGMTGTHAPLMPNVTQRLPLVATPPPALEAALAEPVTEIDELPPMPALPAEMEADLFDDDVVRAPPRRTSPAARLVVAACVAVAAVIGAGGLFRAMQAREQRIADDARARASAPSVTAAEPAPAIPVPVPPSATPPTEPSAAEGPTASAAPMPTDTGTATPTPTATATPTPTATATPTVAPVRPAAAAAQEAPLDTGTDPAKGSLVAQASRALSRGATARAVELSRQAVAANPSNADAWLTLGAAYQASGNLGAAHDAYRSCVAQAHTANVSECRFLAGP